MINNGEQLYYDSYNFLQDTSISSHRNPVVEV